MATPSFRALDRRAGAIAMLGAVHARHGALPWAKLFEPAIRSAEGGVAVPKRMARFLNMDVPQADQPDVRALFSRADGSPLQAGDRFSNAAYAATLKRIASQGPRALLESPLRDKIIARTHGEPRAGTLAAADFDAYQPRISDPLCGPYLVYLVCVPPPPPPACRSCKCSRSSTARTSRRAAPWIRGPRTCSRWRASSCMRTGQVRRGPRVHSRAGEGNADPHYVIRRAALIGETQDQHRRRMIQHRSNAAPMQQPEAAGTSHFVVVDRDGNIASMTTRSNRCSGRPRGGRLHAEQPAHGYPYRPVVDGVPVANAVEGGKRRAPRWRR